MSNDEIEIRSLIEGWAKAVRAGDWTAFSLIIPTTS